MSFTARDSTESSAVLRFNIRSGLEAAPAMAAAHALRHVIIPITSCTIVRQSVVYPAIEPMPTPALAGSDSRRVGVFLFSCTTPDQYAIIEIAGIRDSLLVTSGNAANLQLDTSAPPITAFVAELTSGRWCTPFGHILAKLEIAFLQIRL